MFRQPKRGRLTWWIVVAAGCLLNTGVMIFYGILWIWFCFWGVHLGRDEE